MIKVLFVCYGNICRSPMAEYLFKDMVEKLGLGDQFEIASAATSAEEVGNPVHSGTKEILSQQGIYADEKRAVTLNRADYEKYDYLIGMDEWNIKSMRKITDGDLAGKIFKLLDFAQEQGDIADPWYTGDFSITYRDIMRGCKGFIEYLKKQGMI
ncbi:MAG: low molecular weight phosphotyrosine protein phosphatase [Clostridiales bacterium]|nr:low molecular weight phosphotyrosine protein phosphatase [Clostridiales bacterium]